jgi:hypothetical protein
MLTLLNRPKGRPKDRWWDSVRGDLKIVGVLDWEKSVLDRKYRQGILEQPKTHPGLWSLVRRRRVWNLSVALQEEHRLRLFEHCS